MRLTYGSDNTSLSMPKALAAEKSNKLQIRIYALACFTAHHLAKHQD